jgi:hypothetical protein
MGYGLIGVLVGFGSQLACGCTSIFFCGLPKLGRRFITESVVIVMSAMSVANLRKNVQYPSIITSPDFIRLADDLNFQLKNYLVLGACLSFIVVYTIYLMFKNRKSELKEFSISVLTGFLYGIGLAMSGMVKPDKVLGLLSFDNFQDSELLVTFAVAIGINFLTFYYIYDHYGKYPIWNSNLEGQETHKINLKRILGCIIFGLGWGTAGICPSVAIMTSFLYLPHLAMFLVFVFVGQEIAMKIDIE